MLERRFRTWSRKSRSSNSRVEICYDEHGLCHKGEGLRVGWIFLKAKRNKEGKEGDEVKAHPKPSRVISLDILDIDN